MEYLIPTDIIIVLYHFFNLTKKSKVILLPDFNTI